MISEIGQIAIIAALAMSVFYIIVSHQDKTRAIEKLKELQSKENMALLEKQYEKLSDAQRMWTALFSDVAKFLHDSVPLNPENKEVIGEVYNFLHEISDGVPSSEKP